MEQIGLGILQLTPDQLYDLTLRTYLHKLEGFNEFEQSKYRSQMEAARLTAGIVLGSFSEKEFALEDLFPFSWEKETERLGQNYNVDPEEFKQRAKAWKLM